MGNIQLNFWLIASYVEIKTKSLMSDNIQFVPDKEHG